MANHTHKDKEKNNTNKIAEIKPNDESYIQTKTYANTVIPIPPLVLL